MTIRRGRLLGTLAVAAAGAAVAGAGVATAGGTPPAPEVVMSGLDNPRDVAFGPDGALYVVEAGTGGTEACFASPEGGAPTVGGATGGVTRLIDGRQQKVVKNLPSVSEPGGVAAIGAHGIAFRGKRAVVTIGLTNDPAVRVDGCGTLGPSFGKLLRLGPDRHRGSVLDVRPERTVDVAAYEAANNPDGGVPDSNPYGVLTGKGGTYLTDAGANALLHVDRAGVISTVATFPSRAQGRETDSVPTSVVRVKGGFLVGELGGFPFTKGASSVYKVVPGEEPTVHLDGFTGIIDLAVGKHGDLYVLEGATETGLEGPGRLTRVAEDGTRTVIAEEGLLAPGGVAIGEDGAAYVSNCGIFPGAGADFPCNGEVLRYAGADRK
jgi:hypothetical protein